MERVLEEVKEFADRAHGDQTRKYTPERYIVHPVRVMNICREHTASLPVLAAALLHDVLEDTAVKEEELYEAMQLLMNEDDAKQTVQLVVELTDVYTKQAFPYWNRRKRKLKEVERMNKIGFEAQTIKYADIIDNSKEIVQYDKSFGPKFLFECKALLQKMPKGDPQLYKEAVAVVNQSLKEIL